jgi:hypothetical protein
MNEQSQGILDAFAHVRDVYRSVSKLLIASDAVLYEHGYAPYATWRAAEGKVFLHGHPDGWIQHRAVRQYYRAGMVNQEILTVGAMLWNPRTDLVGEPLCIASFARVPSVNTDDVYRLPLMQAHDLSAPPDGEVRYLDPSCWRTQDGARDAFKRLVSTERMLSVALPLVEITSTTLLEKLLVRPLVARVAADFPLGAAAGPTTG